MEPELDAPPRDIAEDNHLYTGQSDTEKDNAHHSSHIAGDPQLSCNSPVEEASLHERDGNLVLDEPEYMFNNIRIKAISSKVVFKARAREFIYNIEPKISTEDDFIEIAEKILIPDLIEKYPATKIQISVKIHSEKIQDDGKPLTGCFHIFTQAFNNDDNLLPNIMSNLKQRITDKTREGSGWLTTGIDVFSIYIYRRGRVVAEVGKYVKLPEGFPGGRHLLNIQSEIPNCLNLCINAHFELQQENSTYKIKSLKHAETYFSIVNSCKHLKYQFPDAVIHFNDIIEYEIKNNIAIDIYQANEVDSNLKKQKYIFSKIRTSTIRVTNDRKIHLLKYKDHCILIKDILKFQTALSNSAYACLAKTQIADGKKYTKGIFTLQADSLELNLIHFYLRENRKAEYEQIEKLNPHLLQKPAFFYNYTNEFFPKLEHEGPLSLQNIGKIEKQCQLSIYIYHLGRTNPGLDDENKQISLTLVRKGKNEDANAKNVFLCCLDDTNYTVLITDIQMFLARMRKKHFSIKELNDREFCFNCMHPIKTNIEHHKKICGKLLHTASISMPGENQKFKFTNFIALEQARYVGFLDLEAYLPKDEKSEKILQEHKFAAGRYIITDHNYEIVTEREVVSENISENGTIVESFLDSMINDFKNLIISNRDLIDSKPSLTNQDKINFDNTHKCEVCDTPFKNNSDKHRHHDWYKKPVLNENKDVVVGNYLGALCFKCNVLISQKRACMPVYTHNMGGYDGKLLLEGLTGRKFSTHFVSRSGSNFIQIKVKQKKNKDHDEKSNMLGVESWRFGLNIRDSKNFLAGSLDQLASTLKDSTPVDETCFPNLRKSLVKAGYSEQVIESCLEKGVFPYCYLDSPEKLYHSLPGAEAFRNILRNEDEILLDVSQKELIERHDFAQKLYIESKCKNLRDYMSLYLKTDVLLLAEIFNSFRREMIRLFKIDPAQTLTLPSFALDAALYTSKQKFSLLTKIEHHVLFENGIRGGFTSVIQNRVTFNDPKLKNFNKNEPVTTGAYLDMNSLYPTVMYDNIVYGDLEELNDEEIKNFNIESIDVKGAFAYALEIDYTIPDDVKLKTDELPLSVYNKTISDNELSHYMREECEKVQKKVKNETRLVADHSSQEKYLISLDRLKVMKKLGVKITKINRIFRFKQEPFLKDFIDQNINLRKSTNSKFKKKRI